MTKKLIWHASLFFLLLSPVNLSAQSIEEKKASLHGSDGDLDKETEKYLLQINHDIQFIHTDIQRLYDEVLHLYLSEAPPAEYRSLLVEINQQRKQLSNLENRWRELATKDNHGEDYGLWHAPDTTLEQLIIDYGSQDYVYLIPPDVGAIKLTIDSNLPIPRSSWREMLELILRQNGVGIQILNPYLRQLYLIKEDNSNLKLITNRPEDLEILPPDTRVCFVLSPEPSEVRRTFVFLEKFINPNTTVLQTLGRDILIIGRVIDVQDLLRLYQFISINRGEKDYRLIPLSKIAPDEMSKILEAIFDQQNSPVNDDGASGAEMSGLKVVILENIAQALFLVGSREEVKKAEEIIHNVESQVGGARDREIFWYSVKNSNAQELADVLYRVYAMMVSTGVGYDDNGEIREPAASLAPEPAAGLLAQGGYYQSVGGGSVVNPMPAEPGIIVESDPNEGRQNFIVDLKTGSIVMVVEADILPKLKELIAKLDVPKKMVQIETLLFEKVLKKENTFGLNLLRIGENVARNINRSGFLFNTARINNSDYDFDNNESNRLGISEFFISRKKSSGIPAFDLAYRFLLSQEDVQINSSPSVLAINQTTANIVINEEISISNGSDIFNDDGLSGRRNRNAGESFTRNQYGISISLKPTIHINDDCSPEGYDYVTLETDINFDTVHPGGHSARPNVTRRKIKNEVDVVDGETIILGGLRRKTIDDNRDSVPFIGELPGIGKLFSINSMKDKSTEMFIFITPRIIKDPKEQMNLLRQEMLCLRPGDIPYFLECVEDAYQLEKECLMQSSLSLLLGRQPPRMYISDSYGDTDDCCQ